MRDTLCRRLLTRVVIDAASGCWIWTGARQANGYGVIGRDGGTARTHRLAYEMFIGPVPTGHELHHECRNRPCCNPEHLEPVRPENHPDTFSAVNGKRTHCVNGHPLSGDNLYLFNGGHRACRTCRRATAKKHNANREYHREHLRAWRAKQRAAR